MTQDIFVEELLGPKPSQLPSTLGFGKIFANRIFSQEYNAESGWSNARISSYKSFMLDPACTVFHNGQMIFDGLKAYRRPDGNINLFRPFMNAERFNKSASRMGMPNVDPKFHVSAIKKLVSLENEWVPDADGTALYIRPTMISSEKTLEVRASKSYIHYIILSPVDPYFTNGLKPIGVYVSTEFVRSTPGGTGEAKTPGNYAGSIAATEIALKKGYQQVLWLDSLERKFIDEVGAMNIAFVDDSKRVITPQLSGAILHGVTRDSLKTLSSSLGHEFIEKKLRIEEVVKMIKKGEIVEMFGMGTGALIAPVGKLFYEGEEITVGNGETGSTSSLLYKSLLDIQYGRKIDPYDWTETIKVK